MKYIKKVILENFQSHKYTELEFDKHLNVIVGPSDQGKSAIIRGIKWALFNEPAGDFFIREGEKECSVTLVFNDNTKIKRYRSKSKNLYLYYDINGEEIVYEGFGNRVPNEIKENIDIRKIHLDTDETNSINISEQLEGPFLLSEKKSTRANAIGRLVGVHIVDAAIKNTVKDIINLNSSKRNLMSLQSILNENLKDYTYLDELEKNINELEQLLLRIKENQEKNDRLVKLKYKLDLVKSEIVNAKKIVCELENIEYVENIQYELDLKTKIYALIKKKQRDLIEFNKKTEYNKQLLNRLSNIEQVEDISKLLYNKKENHTKMLRVNTRFKRAKQESIYNKDLLKRLENIKDIEKSIKLIEDYSYKLNILIKLKRKTDDISKRMAYGDRYLNELSTLNNLEIVTKKIEQLSNKREILLGIREKYVTNLKEKRSLEKNINKEKEETRRLLKRYKELLSKFEVCPLCFNKIDIDTINRLIDNYD